MSVLRLLQSHVGNRSRSIPMLHTHYCGYFARHSVASPSTSSGKLYYRLLHAASTTQQHSFLLRHVTRLTSSTTPHQTHWPHSTCLSSQSNSISTASNDKHRLVFLGTPEVMVGAVCCQTQAPYVNDMSSTPLCSTTTPCTHIHRLLHWS